MEKLENVSYFDSISRMFDEAHTFMPNGEPVIEGIETCVSEIHRDDVR